MQVIIHAINSANLDSHLVCNSSSPPRLGTITEPRTLGSALAENGTSVGRGYERTRRGGESLAGPISRSDRFPAHRSNQARSPPLVVVRHVLVAKLTPSSITRMSSPVPPRFDDVFAEAHAHVPCMPTHHPGRPLWSTAAWGTASPLVQFPTAGSRSA